MNRLAYLFIAATLLAGCTVEEAENTALVENIPSPQQLIDSLNQSSYTVAKWAVIDSNIQYTKAAPVLWDDELEVLKKNNVNHLRYRDSYGVSDTVVGGVRTVRFAANTPEQEVRWMEVRIRNGRVSYYGVQKGRDNLLSNANITFEFKPPHYTLQLRQQVNEVFENKQYVKALMAPGENMGRGVFLMSNAMMPVNVVVGPEMSQLGIINDVELHWFNADGLRNDSLIFRSEAYDAHFALSAMNDSTYRGWWHNQKSDNPYRIAFELILGPTHRFESHKLPNQTIAGDHALLMYNYDGTPRDTYLLRLEQEHHLLTGSIVTETGDYRFLEGAVIGDSMFLSTMDGTHAYMMKGGISSEQMTGTFSSNPFRSKKWETLPGVDPMLKRPESITTAVGEVGFAFPNAAGEMVRLSDERYAGKPVILSIMGTWCSNCRDEAEFLKEAYRRYHDQGLEVIALDFELVRDSAKSFINIRRHQAAMGIPYEVVLACTGTNKERSAAAVPFLSGVNSYPTMVVLNKDHQIVKIHTGFSGPATGEEAYQRFKQSYFELFESLL